MPCRIWHYPAGIRIAARRTAGKLPIPTVRGMCEAAQPIARRVGKSGINQGFRMLVQDLFNQNRTISGALFDGKPIEIRGQFIGAIDERLDLTLTFQGRIPLYEGYAVGLYRFVDESGNQFVWFASKDKEFLIGKTYRIRATVKAHKLYRNECQTSIVRLTKKGMIDEPIESDAEAGDIWAAI